MPAPSAATITKAITPSWLSCRRTRCRASFQTRRKALPILKVFYRNTNHIQQLGGHAHEALHPVVSAQLSAGESGGEALRDLVRRRDVERAERTFAALTEKSVSDAYNDLQYLVQDYVDVHRVVLAWRAWSLLDLAGKENAHTLLRQSVRFCCDEEKHARNDALRVLLPQAARDQGLARRSFQAREKPATSGSNSSVTPITRRPERKRPRRSHMALAEGFSPEAVGEAISLAANQLVLHDPGRKKEDSPAKPIGSVHGASVGVHASDAANAWRNIARVSNRRNTVASMIVGAYHTAGQTGGLNPKPYPFAEHREKVRSVAPDDLLAEAETAIKAKDQVRACALVHRYGELGRPARPVFDLLLRYAISEDGALHAEKYYRTVTEEFAVARPAFRWNHLAGLARVSASEFGYPAPGMAEAHKLLGV